MSGLMGLMQPGPTLYEADQLRKQRGSMGLLGAVGEPMSYAPGPVGLLGNAMLGAQYLTGEKPMDEGLSALAMLTAMMQGTKVAPIVREAVKFGRGALPQSVKAERSAEPVPAAPGVTITPTGSGLLGDQLSLSVRRLKDGNFAAEFSPQWGQKGKPFHAFGDNYDELLGAIRERADRSEAGQIAASSSKHNKSLLGALQKEYGDVFDVARSTQSKSQYLIHRPSGLKIRISDHKLPLHYEQPDLDLPAGWDVSAQFNAVAELIGK